MKRISDIISKTDIRNLIAVLYTVLIIFFLFCLLFVRVPAENKDLVNVIGVSMVSGVGLILGFFFSSRRTEKNQAND
jgi:uncharacterized BrkB/YihY/UPF0761 family membrane protein